MIDELQARLKSMEDKLTKMTGERNKLYDAHYHSATRLVNQREKATGKAAALRKAKQAELRQKVKDAKVRMARAFNDAQEALVDKKVTAIEQCFDEHAAAERVKLFVARSEAAAARKRARIGEKEARWSGKRLKRAQAAEQERDVAVAQVEECDKTARALSMEAKEAADKLASMPTWRPARGNGGGRGGNYYGNYYYVVMWEMHANGTPASAIGKNIVSIVRAAASWLEPVEATISTITENRCACSIRIVVVS